MDHLSTLPVDLFIQQITYLPFNDVISLCSSNTVLHNYCTNPQYSDRWRALIYNTYGSLINYQELLEKIWLRYNVENVYNYIIYTNFIKVLPERVQLEIYYRQGDMVNFKNTRYSNYNRVKVLNKILGNKEPYGMILVDGTFKIIDTNGFYKSCNVLRRSTIGEIFRELKIPYDEFNTTKELCAILRNELEGRERLVDLS